MGIGKSNRWSLDLMVPGSCVSTRERHWRVVVEKKNGRFGVVDGPRAVGFIDKFVFWPLVNVIQCAFPILSFRKPTSMFRTLQAKESCGES